MEAGEIKAILRAWDFFRPQFGGSWFSQGVVKPGKRPTRLYNPGQPGVAINGPISPTSLR